MSPPDFNENLAEILGDGELSSIANSLIQGIEDDISSRSDWQDTYVKALKYCGLKIEDFQDKPYVNACQATDATLMEAVLTFQANGRAELFPNSGPTGMEVKGEVTTQKEDQADRVGSFLNNYYTNIDKEYYPDSDRMLMYIGLVGCGFRKVYLDPILKRPIARFIDPQNFIVNNDAVSILSSDRLTHVLYLNKTEVMIRQQEGVYRDVELSTPDSLDDSNPTDNEVRRIDGISLDSYDKRSLYRLYEVHTNLVLDEDNSKEDDLKDSIPLPYIVTMCPDSRKILSIRRNWKEGDEMHRRKEYFVQHNYLPGFGIYGLGLSHLLGSNAIVLTKTLRKLLDAADFENYPAGFCSQGLRIDDNNLVLKPGEWRPVQTGGVPPNQAFYPLPYKGPSPALMELRKELLDQTRNLASIPNARLNEDLQNAAVGSTLALLEKQNILISSVFRSLHASLKNEFQLMYDLFKTDFPIDPLDVNVKGKTLTLSRDDFLDDFSIVPASDPAVSSHTQRIIRAEAILNLAMKAPEIHDMRAVFEKVYQAMKVEDIDELLPAPQEAFPVDPLTEVANVLTNKPVVTAPWQDHKAYITILQNSPAVQMPAGQALIQEHIAQDYLVTMQQMMGIQLPPIAQLKNPEVQNQIAVMASQALTRHLEEQQAANPPAPDPNQVLLLDIQQREKAAEAKEREVLIKTESDAYKDVLKYDIEKKKIASQEKIATQKNKTDLAIQSMKEKEFNDQPF